MITLTTDFGADSPYVAQMKGSIFRVAPNATIVDITHSIGAQDVTHGALVWADTAFQFPAGSIHVAVVDPGVGTERSIVLASIDGHWFIAPDNGLLTGVAQGRDIEQLRRVENRQLWREPVSDTFHGRDIMGPVAAHLTLGTSPEEVGPAHEKLNQIPWPTCKFEQGHITGEVVMVDSFGNLITNIFRSDLDNLPANQEISIRCAGQVINGICRTYAEHSPSDFIALFGSSDRLEIAVVSGNASHVLGIERGESVTVG